MSKPLSNGMAYFHCTISPIAHGRLKESAAILGASQSEIARQAIALWLCDRCKVSNALSRAPGSHALHLYLWPSIAALLTDSATHEAATVGRIVDAAIVHWCSTKGQNLIEQVRSALDLQNPERIRLLEQQRKEDCERLSILRTQYSYYRSTGNTMRSAAIAREIEQLKQSIDEKIMVG